MGMIPIRVPSARPWAMRCSIGPTVISTIDWSKTIVVSSSAIIPCVGSEAWPRHRASAAPSMRVRQFFRVRTMMKQQVPLARQREVFHHQLDALSALMLVA
jgi:hypothetical protein